MERSRKYRPNYYLIGLLAIGAVILVMRIILYIFFDEQFFNERVRPLELGYIIIRILSAQMVYLDDRKI